MGARRKPPQLRIIEGNRSRTVIPKAPEIVEGVQDIPEWLGERAARIWARVVPLLQRRELVDVTDTDMLATYCVLLARVQQAEEDEDEKLLMYAREFRMFAVEFGLSPASRSKLAITTDKGEGDEWRKLMQPT